MSATRATSRRANTSFKVKITKPGSRARTVTCHEPQTVEQILTKAEADGLEWNGFSVRQGGDDDNYHVEGGTLISEATTLTLVSKVAGE